MLKEAKGRIKINNLLQQSGWRFFDSSEGPTNISLENNVKITQKTLDECGNDFDKTKNGFIDFLLLDKNGFPLVVLEAKSEDKDPLDVMVLSTFPTFPGCVIPCRPIGAIRLLDTGEEDNKIVAVPVNDPRFEQVKDLSDLPPHSKKEISNFWENYSELQPEKKIKVLGWSGREKAWEMIKEGVESYRKIFGVS